MKEITFENVTTEQAAMLSELYAAIKNGSVGDFSDGYHTFNELYHHRAVLFATLCNSHPELAWKSLHHHDPEQPMYDGMFIVGINTPEGQATYHYDINPYWDMFKVPELEAAPEWDGHTPEEAIRRIGNLSFGLKEYDPNIQTDKTHTVCATLMQWEYVGHVIVKMGGNCRGKSILECIDFETETEFDTPYAKNDCDLMYHEDGDYFTGTLHDRYGNTLEFEADSTEMNDMLVAVEITDLKKED